MKKIKLLITLPNLNLNGGVSAYWNSLLKELNTYEQLEIELFEIGSHKNLLDPIIEQFKLYKLLKNNYDLVIINPSLGIKSFFRDGLFSILINKSKTNFLTFFHGWNKDFEKKVNTYFKFFFNISFINSEKIFVLSKDFKNSLIKWGFKNDIIIETTNIDKALLKDFSFQEKETNQNSNKIKILFLARLLKEKGIVELINAFVDLSEKNDNLELLIAGSGEILSELKENHKNNINIKFLGHVENQEKINVFKDSTIYCLPSYSEGLPTSVLEAMAFGLPVITTQVGGLKDFFQDEKMGYFVKLKSSNDIKEKLKLLIENKNKIIEIGNFNHKFAEKNLLNSIVAKRIYEEICKTLNKSN